MAATRPRLEAQLGMTFPAGGRVRRRLKLASGGRMRVGATAAVCIAAAAQYVCEEVLQLAADSARWRRRARITPRDLALALAADDELAAFADRPILPSAGWVPASSSEAARVLRGAKPPAERTPRPRSPAASAGKRAAAAQQPPVAPYDEDDREPEPHFPEPDVSPTLLVPAAAVPLASSAPAPPAAPPTRVKRWHPRYPSSMTLRETAKKRSRPRERQHRKPAHLTEYQSDVDTEDEAE